MQVRKAVEHRRFAIQAVFALLTNSYIIGFIKGTISTGSLKNLCVPGMNCYSCPGAVGSCPIGSLQAVLNRGNYSKMWVTTDTGYPVVPPYYWFAFYVVGFLMLFGALCGRLVCGFLCPFGLIQDLLHKIPLPKKLKIRTFPGDKPLRYLKYVFLVVFVIVLPLLYAPDPFFCKYVCPSGMLLGGIPLMTVGSITGTGITSWAEAGSITALKLTILAVTIILSIMIYRPFCKYVCPLGAIYSFFNRISLYRYSVDQGKCTDCGSCRHACRMGVDITKTPNNPECIRCGDCKAACPHHAISAGFGKIKKTTPAAIDAAVSAK
ncbi:MAG: 4Fe-4S binding protein [Christensenellaceae bacterium]|nr:4Fe-4S binding protein [Christensenellaceae bacterium]